MKLWLTAAEIADLKLPGLPGTKRNVNAHAEAAGWPERKALCRKRRHAGGGIEYSLDLLPPEARKAYVARFVPEAVPLAAAKAAEAEPAAVHLRSSAAEARDARLAILAVADRVFANANLPRLHADLVTIADYRANKIDLPEWVRAEVPELSLRTLQRWRASVQAGQATALAVDRGAARRGSGVLDQAENGQVRVYCLALIATQPHLSADHVRAMLLKRFGETLTMVRAGGVVKSVPLPPVRTLQDALKRWKATEKVALTAITNPDAFKSRHKLSGANTDRSVTRLNEVWQIDASPMDALCVDGRHSVYLAIDVFSRRAIVYVSRTPRAEAVGLMLRRAILAWGVPERIKTDNGSDFTAKSIQRLLASLGIERELSPAFTPEAKAFVERVIGTFQRDFAPLLPGFIGHSVADRKVIEARKAFAQRLGESDANAFAVELSAAELQGYCDRWAADRYQHRPHSGLDGATPYTAAAAYTGRTRTLDDVRCLDILLAPIPGRDGLRTVGKQGLRIEKSLYLAPHIMPDTQVFVRMDPNDLGRAFLFSVDGGQYLGEAVCPEILGVDPAQAVAHAKKAQKDLISVATAQIRREAKKIRPRDFVETILEQAAEKSGNLVAFPRPGDAHATPATRAAVEALSDVVTLETWPAPAAKGGPSEGDRALRAEIEADLASAAPPAADNVQPLRLTETKQQRFRRAMDLLARIEAGEAIPTKEAVWLGGYQAGSEFRALSDLYADFGEAALK